MKEPRKMGQAETAYTIPRDVRKNPVRKMGDKRPDPDKDDDDETLEKEKK